MTELLPKISIITPSYNQAAFLERTILSIINQNYPNLEYVIVDGGSTDGSIEIIKKYEEHLFYWISEKDKGTYDANNKALKLITGDFWCIVNSDDVLLPNAINAVIDSILANPKEKWFAAGVEYIDEMDIVIGAQDPIRPEPIEGFTFLHGCWISHPAVFLNRDIINEIGFFEKHHLMDMNYWLRMEKAGYSPFIIQHYLSGLRLHRDCKSSDRIKLQEEFLRVFASFVHDNKLDKKRAIRSKTRFNILHYYKLRLFEYLVQRNFKFSLLYLFKVIWIVPRTIFTRWYWGAMKRMIVGFAAGDPLLNQFKPKENKANWSTVDH